MVEEENEQGVTKGEDVVKELSKVTRERDRYKIAFEQIVDRHNTIIQAVSQQSTNVQIIGGELAKIVASGTISKELPATKSEQK